MEPAPTALANGSRFEDRYEIAGELGSGSFGRVYQARQLSTGQSVAIKLLSARDATESSTGREADRFRRETRICADLSHTNIVGLIDSGETRDGQLYAVFACVPGETLAEVLARDGALGVREAVRLMTQVLEALEYSHAKGIVHRDLKPSNLMLSGSAPRRNAVVLDFGLGGLAEGRRRAEWQTLTQTREFLGTPLYASPEQLAGEAATERSDLYAWGLIFLECLTGRHPFEGEGAVERLLTGGGSVEIPEWLREHRLGEVLEKVTAREAEKCDVSVEWLIEELDAIAGGGELPEAPEEAAVPPPLSDSGELRHLTVMFCDLVDSTGLTQRLDAEAYGQVVQAYQARASATVERYAGHVAQYLGDGLLVYFGWPQAHEDDAERAVRAGRAVLRELGNLEARIEAEHGVRIAARIGIHSGDAVVSDVGGGQAKETLALGDTPTIAARLQGIAEPGTVVISEAAQRLVPGLFVTEDLGTPALKGIAEPLRVYRVRQATGVRSRLDRAPSLTPFVGRTQELGLLQDRFEQAQEGQGQAVWIAGEAGIGKSRLVHQLRERLRETPHTWLECRTSPYTQQSAFSPLIELLEQALGFEEDEPPDRRFASLERGLVHAGLELAEAVPLFASLLSLRLPERYTPLAISPQLQRQKTLEALLSWGLALSERQALVLLVEDLHWADPSTLEWLGLLIEQCPTARVLLLLTFRPEFQPPWPARAHVLPLGLNRLGRRQAKELVAAASGEPLPGEVIDRLAARSDGIPLFVEELAKGVVESSRDRTAPLSAFEIPDTLHDSLMARLDRLAEAKRVAQVGAALGREFPYALLESVAPLTEAALRDGLGRLVEAELVYQRGLPPKSTYTFKHALVQDTAYQSLLESQRRELHGRIADALDRREEARGEPEVIARHCEEAGRTAEAIGHYDEAGKRAARRSALSEGIGHLQRAIELLSTLPASPDRDRRELRLQIALGAPLQAARGMFHTEVEETYARALALSRSLGDGSERFHALAGLATFYRNREIDRAMELGEELLAHAERTGDPAQLLFAHSTLSVPLHFRGDLAEALAHEERALSVYDASAHRSLESHYGLDPGITARCFESFTRLQLGCADRALQSVEEAIARARAHDHPYGLAYALNWAAIVDCWRGEPRRVMERTGEAIEISTERGLGQQLVGALIFRGWARSVMADAESAARDADETSRRMGGPFTASQAVSGPFITAHADAQRRLHRPEVALDALDSWLAFSTRIRGPYWDAEALRLRGEILLETLPAEPEEAESHFSRAAAIAKSQKAKSLELRAACSLAGYWRRRGRHEEARSLLRPIYDWFTEGFDTQDLKEAKALLGDSS